ncbi:MAG: nucleotidyltransferase domain-containing protein [archaeon]
MVENINNMILDIIGLYRCNYLTGFHVRQMAQLIGKSHVSLLPHLKELEENKILVSKYVGKSRVYSLNLGNSHAREFLSFSEKKKSLWFLDKEVFIKKIHDESIGFGLAGCLILFGSYASGTNSDSSDIDLLYLGDIAEGDKKKIKNLGKTYHQEIHLVSMDLKEFRDQLLKSGALAKEVINNHIILYNHDIFINELLRYYNGKKEG